MSFERYKVKSRIAGDRFSRIGVSMKKKDNMAANPTEIILESISDGVFTVNHKWRIMSFNRAAEEITGIPRAEAIGRYCWEVFRSNMCEGDCALKRTMKEGKSFISTSTSIINSDKKRIPIEVSTSLLKDEEGEILGGVETFRDNSVVEELRKELKGRFQQGDMVSCSKSMKDIFAILPQIALSDSAVLIEGETGTGKELMAKALHNLSLRKEKPFVAINCGALPDTLLESELFGYKAGAFTNATRDKPGYFSAASGGTILLDEIGETSPAFQVKLLRVLEEKEFQPLGSVEKHATDVRIIAATNKKLTELVKKGQFRQDLFFRINIVRLELPVLQKRKEDIPVLIERFISKMNHIRGTAVTGIDNAALELLMRYDYPGNIRELENIIEYAFVLCSHDKIGVRHLPNHLIIQSPSTTSPPSSMNMALKATEAETILAALERNDYNRAATAKDLGMHKSTLFRKIKKLHLTLPAINGRTSQKKTP